MFNYRKLPLALGFCALAVMSFNLPTVYAQEDHSGHTAMNEVASTSKPDMKALFGEDYRPGDVGHSTGTVKGVADDGYSMVIDHGQIHGIGMAPMTMSFDLMGDASVDGIAEGDSVEFLVRKGRDNSYRVFMICKMKSENETCLASVMNQ